MPADSQASSPVNVTNSPHSQSSPPPHQNQQQQYQQLQQPHEEEEVEEDAGIEHQNDDVITKEAQNDDLKLQQQNHTAHDLDLSSDVEVEQQSPPSEFLCVDLLAIRKEVQCPICLGIIKKTRTVMECLHRFCRVCIDKSMRMGNNECPACRTHCASRRSLRDDPRFDELIAALYPDIKKFEEEELAFYEEDESRNKQIQDSITHVIAKQTEALGKKRSGNKDTAGSSAARSQRNYQGNQAKRRRRRRRNGLADYQESDDNIDVNDSDKHLSPDEQPRETTQRKRKGRANVAMSQSPTTNLSEGSLENNVEQRKEERGLSPGIICSPEMLAWGKGGVRSTTRYGNTNGSMNRSDRRIRLAKLVDFLRNLEENDDEDTNGHSHHPSTLQPLSFNNEKLCQVTESLQDKLHALDREEKLPGALTSCVPNGEQLVPAYQQKEAI
ncbi:hypothetical protein KSS87_010355 [Heliosperma pusillum]|nr:hypothetical protein KSS87_010355 [Heliosperma pusillum]